MEHSFVAQPSDHWCSSYLLVKLVLLTSLAFDTAVGRGCMEVAKIGH